MKRIFTTLVIAFLALGTIGCSTGSRLSTRSPDDLTPNNSTTVAGTQIQPSETPSDEAEAVAETSKESTSEKVESSVEETKKAEAVIIAKSDNAVSDKDKEAVLKDLDAKLDELFTSINELEDIQDQDLN